MSPAIRPAVVALGLSLAGAAAAAAQQTQVLVINGLSGSGEHAASFSRWAATFIDAAQRRWQVPPEQITYLAENPALDPTRIRARSTAEEIDRALADMARRAAPDDAILILIIGHGSVQGSDARVSLPGPDLTAADFRSLLDRFPTQRVALVNTASASGDWVAALSGTNRTIVTATRTGGEKNETVFAEYFVQAFAGDGADTDKDGLVSLLEAFEFARREVARFYESQNRLQTEHALLDDNGDGSGSREPDPSAGDGANARRFVLMARGARTPEQADDPVLTPLYAARRRLEGEIAELRTRKEATDSTAYEGELERLLVELATTNQEIRAKEAAP